MARKKQKPEDESPKPSRPPKSKAKPKAKAKPGPTPKAMPPLAAMESLMKELLGATDDPAQARAEALLGRAYESDDPARAAALARQALEAWPDCADAYVLLAEEARGPQEALDLYTRGLDAARRALGEAALRESVGHYWGILATRPLMRSLRGVAQSLWVLGRRDEAVERYGEMLRLNPGDNQGVRYNLLSCLIELDRDDDAEALLGDYAGDGSACWAYGAALLAFRREGDGPEARGLLAAARKVNKFVPDYLTGREMIPSHLPEMIGRGDRDEAVDYAVGNLNAWRASPEALAWLRRSSAKPGRRAAAAKPKAKAKAAKGPGPAVKKRLMALPQPDGSAWQAEARRLPVWMNVAGEMRRPWIVIVVDRVADLILAQEVIEGTPTAGQLWSNLARAMESPGVGTPHRPATLEVRSPGPWDELRPHVEGIGVTLAGVERLELIDDILEKLVEHICGRPPGPGLLDMPGITPAMVAGFFHAAAEFYRAAPWQRVGGTETIEIACDRFESGPWYAVVIGQMGMTLGVALYEDLHALARMREGRSSDEDNARETVALSVTYGDETEIPIPDLDAAGLHGWEVAGPDAYPAPIRKERGLTMRPPLAWELRLLEATLRALPGFILHHDRGDPKPEAREVPTASGPLTLRLAWMTGEPGPA